MNGYTTGGTKCHDTPRPLNESASDFFRQLPIAVMQITTFTHLEKDLAEAPKNRKETHTFKTNDNTLPQENAIFYGGQIYCQLGAFVMANYAGLDQAFALERADFRYAEQTKVAGVDVTYGAFASNRFLLEDPWNTSPAWLLPDPRSAFANGPPAESLISGLGGVVAGGGAYAFINNSIYASVSAYDDLPADTIQSLGHGVKDFQLDGAAVAWRLAYEHNWNDYSLMVGTFGMTANHIPDPLATGPANKITDLGFDAQFQYLEGVHFFTARATYIHEWDKLNFSTAIDPTVNLNNHLNELTLSATYAYDATYAITAGYISTTGSNDGAFFGTLSGRPDTAVEFIDIGFSPFSRGGPSVWPWLNTRFGLQYWHYDKVNGASKNYDPDGRNASDDNTVLLYSWTAF